MLSFHELFMIWLVYRVFFVRNQGGENKKALPQEKAGLHIQD
jgi:hypothetical protein